MLLCVNITLLLLLLRLNMYTVEETAFITDCKTTPGKKVHTTKLFTRHLSCKPGVHLLILVTSHAWTGYKRRLTVRETWGTYRKDRNANTNKTWQTFFVVASRLPTTYNKHNEYKIRAATAELRAEMEAYQDIIEGDFEETFYNLPLKLQIGFEWAHFYCNASYIHKTDDDVFLNTKNVFPFLANLPTENVYSGFVQWRAGVHRTRKYKVTFKEYSGKFYPPFVGGATMFFSPDVIARLVGLFPEERVFKLEDVYIGLLINKLGLNASALDPRGRKGFWEIMTYNEPVHLCRVYPYAIVRAVYFFESDKRWCLYKLYYES